MGINIIDQINILQDKTDNFRTCVSLLGKEEKDTNDEEIIDAWKKILRKLLNEIHALLGELKERIAWSMLDDMKSSFRKISGDLAPTLDQYKDYEDEKTRKVATEITFLLDEGGNGFRQSFITSDYYEKLFYKEFEIYEAENRKHLEVIYSQDNEDNIFQYRDENERKNYMVALRKKELFETTHYGKIYHEKERNIKLFTVYILEQEETNYKDIYDFFGKFLALQIAKEHCKIKNETIFNKHIFKDNTDVDKVMKKLDEFITNKTISAQKHWYIVFKVFLTKNWLKKKTQMHFIDFMNSTFCDTLKCTQDDFKKIEGYFKKHEYSDWTLDDHEAPACCELYKSIADLLDNEFQESKYAKAGTFINARKIEKFR